MNSTVRLVVAIAIMIFTAGTLLPTGIAVLRNHPKIVSIVLWNTLGMLLFGIGWLVALVISLTGQDGAQVSGQGPVIVVQNNVGGTAAKE